MKNLRTTKTEVNQFNHEWEEFEAWKHGFEKEFRPKIKQHEVKDDAPDKPWWYTNLEKAWLAKQRKKAITDLKEFEELTNSVGTAEELKENPSRWLEYCQEREIKRKPGRPRIPSDLRKQNLRSKRSDEMQTLLESHGYMVEDGWVFDNLGSRWCFMPNGKIELSNKDRISVHNFLTEQGTL